MLRVTNFVFPVKDVSGITKIFGYYDEMFQKSWQTWDLNATASLRFARGHCFWP